MVIPAVLAAKLTGAILDPFASEFYKGVTGSPLSSQDQEITQFISCAVVGFVFVAIGLLGTRRIRRISVWFFIALGVMGAIGVYPINGLGGLAGQISGIIFAAYIFVARAVAD